MAKWELESLYLSISPTKTYIYRYQTQNQFKGLLDLNESGFIKTSGLAETSVPGIFTAGDCREGAIAQVAAATGEGILASYGIRNYLK